MRLSGRSDILPISLHEKIDRRYTKFPQAGKKISSVAIILRRKSADYVVAGDAAAETTLRLATNP